LSNTKGVPAKMAGATAHGMYVVALSASSDRSYSPHHSTSTILPVNCNATTPRNEQYVERHVVFIVGLGWIK